MTDEKTQTEKKLIDLFESGAMLIRQWNDHTQMLMNEGTFVALVQQETEELRNEISELKASKEKWIETFGKFCKSINESTKI